MQPGQTCSPYSGWFPSTSSGGGKPCGELTEGGRQLRRTNYLKFGVEPAERRRQRRPGPGACFQPAPVCIHGFDRAVTGKGYDVGRRQVQDHGAAAGPVFSGTLTRFRTPEASGHEVMHAAAGQFPLPEPGTRR